MIVVERAHPTSVHPDDSTDMRLSPGQPYGACPCLLRTCWCIPFAVWLVFSGEPITRRRRAVEMTERKGGLSPQAREFVAVGASIGAGCHPCVTHHLKAGAEAGLGAQELEAAITAAERVIADSSARMAQHARRQLPAPAGSAGADGPAVAVALAALGAAVAANSMPNIERYLTEAAQLDVSGGELTDAVNVAHEVQRNAARIHAQRTGELLDAPP